MLDAARRTDVALYVGGRGFMARVTVKSLRAYRRDLDAMTVEELESALTTWHASTWEYAHDETPVHADPFVPRGTIIGLSEWLP